MPTDKSRYHSNFDKRSDKVIQQPCTICGNLRGGWCITVNEKLDTVAIQAHHPNHDPWNGKAKLMPLCEQCHLKIDKWYSSKKSSYTMKGKRYKEMAENGQQELTFKISTKGRKLDLVTALLLVDSDWITEYLIAYLKAELNKPNKSKKKAKADQLQLFAENEGEVYPIVEVDFPVAQFVQSVPLAQ